MFRHPWFVATLVLWCVGARSWSAQAQEVAARFTGPWNVTQLKRAPAATWGEKSGLLQQVVYEGEPLNGKPTQVFAYASRPQAATGKSPAMLLVHGGGGKAFAEWATLWAERGYVALAMDLAGNGPDGKRIADGGPGQGDDTKFGDFTDAEVDRMWTYHAVAAVLRGHSLLASLPEVDASRIGVTGISWGGYLTCIVAGIDDRLKVAVPVYGCGFLDENSVWIPRFEKMSAEQRQRWVRFFEPSKYLAGVSCPILFVNGTNDFAYPLDSYQKSYRLVKGRRDLCIKVAMPHGHQQGWAPAEIGLYVDSVLRKGDALPTVGPPQIESGRVRVTVKSSVPLTKAQWHSTPDGGPWQKRTWQTVDAQLADGVASAELPVQRPLVGFLTITDQRGAVVSSEHVEMK